MKCEIYSIFSPCRTLLDSFFLLSLAFSSLALRLSSLLLSFSAFASCFSFSSFKFSSPVRTIPADFSVLTGRMLGGIGFTNILLIADCCLAVQIMVLSISGFSGADVSPGCMPVARPYSGMYASPVLPISVLLAVEISVASSKAWALKGYSPVTLNPFVILRMVMLLHHASLELC